jgi:hypothetical protein
VICGDEAATNMTAPGLHGMSESACSRKDGNGRKTVTELLVDVPVAYALLMPAHSLMDFQLINRKGEGIRK